MILKLTTGVRDQKAAGSNPATSTREQTGMPQRVSRFVFYMREVEGVEGYGCAKCGKNSPVDCF